MAYTFDEFCADCQTSVKGKQPEAAHEAIRRDLERLLGEAEFVAAECGPDAAPGIRTIHRDAETGFNVLVHIYEKGKSGPPHDHGASWAVYGQAAEHTDMTAWKRLDDGSDDADARLEKAATVRLNPGMAGKFEPGDIHSIHFPDGAKFVRVTGTDLDTIATKRFNPDTATAKVGSRL